RSSAAGVESLNEVQRQIPEDRLVVTDKRVGKQQRLRRLRIGALRMKRAAGKRRRQAAPVDAQELVVQPSAEPATRQPAGQGCQATAPPTHGSNVAKEPAPPGKSVLAMMLVQELRLEPGHVHVGRALALTRLALQAQVQRLE